MTGFKGQWAEKQAVLSEDIIYIMGPSSTITYRTKGYSKGFIIVFLAIFHPQNGNTAQTGEYVQLESDHAVRVWNSSRQLLSRQGNNAEPEIFDGPHHLDKLLEINRLVDIAVGVQIVGPQNILV
jgi:hypothetical protein